LGPGKLPIDRTAKRVYIHAIEIRRLPYKIKAALPRPMDDVEIYATNPEHDERRRGGRSDERNFYKGVYIRTKS
jgi:hypothetical protein